MFQQEADVMAEGNATYAADQVEQLLKCPVCLDRFNQPKILPCQHTFCKSPCLEGLVDRYSRTLKCPECRVEHFVPRNGAGGFPNNRTITNFLDLSTQATPRSVETDEPAVSNSAGTSKSCGICEKDAETSKCVHCDKLVCPSCKASHLHQLRFDVTRLVNQIRRGIPKLSNSISNAEQKSEQATQHVEGVKSEVRDHIERYIKELRDKQKMIHSELDTFLQGELRNIRIHQENLEVELASISSYCDSTEGLLNRGDREIPDGDLVNIKKQCVDYMEQLRNTENVGLPDGKKIEFKYNGQPLHSSITSFGQLNVESPRITPVPTTTTVTTSTTRTTPRTQTNGTQSSSRNQSRNSPARQSQQQPYHMESQQSNRTRPRWSDSQPVSDLYTSNQSPSPGPSSTPISDPIEQYLRSRSSDGSPPLPATISRAQRELMRRFDAEQSQRDTFVSDFRYTSPRTTPRATDALNQGYMFTMDTETEAILRQMDDWHQAEEEINRQIERNGRRNSTAVLGSEPSSWDDMPVGFMGVGSRGRRGGSSVSSSAPVLPQRQVDSRPAVAFSVNLRGNGRGGRRRGGRGRGGRRPFELTRDNTNINNRQQNASHSDSDRQSPSTQNEERNRSNVGNQVSSRGRNRANGTNTRTQRNNDAGEGTSSGTANSQAALAPVMRSRTFVMDASDNNNVVRPNVDQPSTSNSLDATIGDIMNDHSTENSQENNQANQADQRPMHDYKKKAQMQKKIGSPKSSAEGKFHWPRGVAVSPLNDSIVIADSSNHRVQIFDCNAHFVIAFGSHGHEHGEFDCLAGVAVNNIGQVIIADRYNHRIQVFDRSGAFEHEFGKEGSGNKQMKNPWGVAVDNSGYIYVCDKENHRIQVFTPEGRFVRKFGGLGSENGQLENPHYLALDPTDGRVVVSDTNNHRIQIFDQRGNHMLTFGSEGSDRGKLQSPKGITVDRQGYILVADSGNYRIQIFRPDGRFYYTFGSRGSGNGQFKGLEGIALTRQGHIIVSDKENHRIQIF